MKILSLLDAHGNWKKVTSKEQLKENINIVLLERQHEMVAIKAWEKEDTEGLCVHEDKVKCYLGKDLVNKKPRFLETDIEHEHMGNNMFTIKKQHYDKYKEVKAHETFKKVWGKLIRKKIEDISTEHQVQWDLQKQKLTYGAEETIIEGVSVIKLKGNKKLKYIDKRQMRRWLEKNSKSGSSQSSNKRQTRSSSNKSSNRKSNRKIKKRKKY
jgi:hypothetical protein